MDPSGGMKTNVRHRSSRIVISSEALESLSFAVRWMMFEKLKRETCYLPAFGHRPIYICGEAATFPIEPIEPIEPVEPAESFISERSLPC